MPHHNSPNLAQSTLKPFAFPRASPCRMRLDRHSTTVPKTSKVSALTFMMAISSPRPELRLGRRGNPAVKERAAPEGAHGPQCYTAKPAFGGAEPGRP